MRLPFLRARPFVLVAVVVALVALLVASCGKDDGKNATAVSSDDTKALCDARDQFTASLDALRDVDVRAGGADALEAAVDDVKTAWNSLRDTAREQFRDEVDAVQSALDDLERSVADFGKQDSVSAAVTAVGNAISDLGTAAGALADAVTQDCSTGS